MKVAIIGAGNMGGAIARGMAQGTRIRAKDITVADPSLEKIQQLQSDYAEIKITTDNQKAIEEAQLVFLVVKPWLVQQVLNELQFREGQALISVAAGVEVDDIRSFLTREIPVYRMIPNTAISELASVCLLSASDDTSQEMTDSIMAILEEMGMALLLPENQLGAATALTSCGIAYVLKYIEAAAKAGIELGIYPHDAIQMVAKSVEGAAKIILNNDTHPSLEIDKVTTPGGITIKGLNELDHAGFTSAIIRAMKVSSK
ncbi:MAG: pyrroline-5-carboxylate reductase [Bacteroidales bacterium]|nr:pyrroline-5-carboxylate reductase [Bacteroidales bacterium]